MKVDEGAVRRWKDGRDAICMIKDKQKPVVNRYVHLEPWKREIREKNLWKSKYLFKRVF